MAQSLQRSAGAANTYQVSLEKSIGLTTAIGEVTRESGSVIGNSLKSIYSRITSIPKAVESLQGIGVAVKDSAGEMRSVESILDDVGAKWKDLSAEQQQNLGLQIAGKQNLPAYSEMDSQQCVKFRGTPEMDNRERNPLIWETCREHNTLPKHVKMKVKGCSELCV